MNAATLCATLSERLLPEKMRSQAWRRIFVVAAYALAACTIAAAWQGDGLVCTIFGIAGSSLFGLYWSSIQGLTDRPDSSVDEREKELRDGAHRVAFQALAWVGFPIAIAIAGVFPADRGPIEVAWAITAAWMAVWGMPAAVVAWSQPDEAD